MSIKDNINRLLKEKDMTIAQLCKNTGLAPTTVYSIMQRDTDSITINTLHKLAEAFDVELWDLIDISRETALKAKNINEFFGEFLDDEEYKKNELYSKLYEDDEKIAIDYYYLSIVPILKILGYRSDLFVYENNRTIILKKDNKELEISFNDMKRIISDAKYITEYFLSKNAHKISAQTEKARIILKESKTKETSVYTPTH